MKYGRVNANFKSTDDESISLSLDIHAVGFFTIESWHKILEQRLASFVKVPERWYLSYFVVMDVQHKPCGDATYNHDGSFKG